MKILLVDDDVFLSQSIEGRLKKLGYAIDCAYDGERALELYRLNMYDLIILDLTLPKLDGMEVLQAIRTQDQDCKILILSARNSTEDKIKGLDEGGNDYLTKPFDFDELAARIRNLLRRQFKMRSVCLSCGDLQVDTLKKSVSFHSKKISLTKKEYSILEYLAYNQNRVISSEELVEHVWNSEKDLFSNSFRYHIHSLRKKLYEATGYKGYIVTLHGQGYRIGILEGEEG